jgi:hypothetical protein
MRTAVEVVSPERFEEFITEQQKEIRAGNEAAEKIETKKVAEMEEGGGDEPTAEETEAAEEAKPSGSEEEE